MASDASRMTSTLFLLKGNLRQPHDNSVSIPFTASAPIGPTPGSIAVDVGTPRDVDFAELEAMGGPCWLENEGDNGYVEYGLWDGAVFYPWGELLAGEGHPFRMSRRILNGESGTASLFVVRFIAYTADTRVFVGAYDK